MEEIGKIVPRNIEDEIQESYLDYAMSVIVGRALPDSRDGLKPVHRRILYGMYELGLLHSKSFRKSARIVGDVMGKYHPHGDAAIYDAMVRMAQDFSLRYPLVEGQGNFGSIDGDPPAAMRYTEVRLSAISEEMLSDIDKECIDFRPNFDNTLLEPVFLPAKFPNLLVNGSSGIAVGMATEIPPHNLGEIVDGLIYLIQHPQATIDDLLKIVKGPDFPTGGIIFGKTKIKELYHRGRGIFKVTAVMEIEESSGGKETIVITQLPYQVNKAELLIDIGKLSQTKKIEGIAAIRDESDKRGMRIVIELKKDANAQIVKNQLLKHTQLEISYGAIFISLIDQTPNLLNIKDFLLQYIVHREKVIKLRTQYLLTQSEKKAHIVEGLKIALQNIDEVIKIIRSSKDTNQAENKLREKFNLTEIQTKEILNMRLHQLTSLEKEKLEQEHIELIKQIEKYKFILSDIKQIREVIQEELLEIKAKYADPRRTQILAEEKEEFETEDLIPEEDVVVIISHSGYIKRIPLNIFRTQGKGGRGVQGALIGDDDFIEEIFISSTHAYVMFFTNFGKVYWLKVYEIPESSRQSRGKAIVNLLNLGPQERITAFVATKDFYEDKYLIMGTRKGLVKRVALSNFARPRKTGIKAIKLTPQDELIGVDIASSNDDIFLATKNGLAIRFSIQEIRPSGREAQGVKGINLKPGDEVVGLEILQGEEIILTVTQKGYGKCSGQSLYKKQKRAGRGILNIKVTEKNGKVVGIREINKKEDEIVLITEKGITNRQKAKNIRTCGRNTQGVHLIRLDPEDRVSSLARVSKIENL